MRIYNYLIFSIMIISFRTFNNDNYNSGIFSMDRLLLFNIVYSLSRIKGGSKKAWEMALLIQI